MKCIMAQFFRRTDGNPGGTGEEHPRHAGDLPPVLSNDGTAWMEIYTGRFYPMDVVGRTIVLHEMPDDFKDPAVRRFGE